MHAITEQHEQQPKTTITSDATNTADPTEPTKENENAQNPRNEATTNPTDQKNAFTTGAICLADLANTPLPNVEYVVERLAIAPGRPTVIFGQSGKGKTLFTSYLASCVALNFPLFGKHIVRPGEVLHLDYELGVREMDVRYRQMVVGLGMELEAAPGIWFRSYPRMKLDDPNVREHLVRAMEGKQLVIIDPLSRATSATDNDPKIGDALAMTGELSNEMGVSVIWIHHEGKRVGTGYGRGSSAIQDSAGCVLRVSSPERGQFLVEQVKAVPHPVAPLLFTIEEVGGTAPETKRARGLKLIEFDPEEKPSFVQSTKLDVRQEIIARLEEQPDGMSGRELRKAVGGNTQRFTQSLRVLVAQNIVVTRTDETDARRTIYVLNRNTPEFEPKAGQLIEFPRKPDSDDCDEP